MKIIFLDIDGVLNVIPQGHDEFGAVFHAHFVQNLKRLIAATGAKIVVSSTWRMSGLDSLKRMWAKRELPGEVIDVTPVFESKKKWGTLEYYEAIKRGEEIQDWLNRHPEVTDYVIIDDDCDMLESQMPHFVQCSGNLDDSDCIDAGYGLTKSCTLKAAKILLSDLEVNLILTFSTPDHLK